MEDRTATDVLLAVEGKIQQLMSLHQSLDLNIKLISNKLNTLITAVNDPSLDAPVSTEINPFEMATAPPMNIEEEWKPAIPLSTETAPVGFRRTGRAETFTGAQTRMPAKNTPTPSIKVPEMKAPRSVAPPPPVAGKIPLSQRIVDRNGTSLFKADIEVLDDQGHTVWKGQTNATGKWQAALGLGKYRVNIHKQTTNQKIQVAQDLTVNEKTPKELPVMIVK